MKNSSFVFAILFFLSSINSIHAQLLDGEKKTFSHADSLRGGLRVERICYDVNYYNLNIELDIKNKSITGSNKIYFIAKKDFTVLQIDLFENMSIDKIIYNNQELTYFRDANAVFITFIDTIHKNTRAQLEVFYHGNPIIAKRAPWDGGFVFTKDKDGNDWVAVACEGTGASLWWPCKDYLGDEPDSMKVTLTYPKELFYVGNGKMTSDEIFTNNRKTSWNVSYPINNYNITLNVGNYKQIHDIYQSNKLNKNLDLDYYVLPYNLDKATKQFKQVKPMLTIYEKYLGPYPFWNDGYALVETPYLGMEHQGAIAYGNGYKIGYAGTDYSKIGLDFDYIIIHESGHEWWGNSVSCKDIADMWIHESFCTYSEALYVEGMYGKKKALAYINAKKDGIDNKFPIQGTYGVNSEGDGDMYNKGMLFLNTLRTIVDNDSLWFASIYHLLNKDLFMRNVEYNDIVRVMEQNTKKYLRPVFEQYVQHADIPMLIYKIEDKNRFMKTIYYKWKTDVKGFQMRFYFTHNGKKEDAIATNDWRSFDFKAKKIKHLVINQENMYIQVQELK